MKKLINNIISFIVGWFRYYLYYSLKGKFIRPHIKEQIEVRINSMDRECYNNGSCKECGCSTTALQMANKSCDAVCYPKMMSKIKWKRLKDSKRVVIDEVSWVLDEESQIINKEEDEQIHLEG